MSFDVTSVERAGTQAGLTVGETDLHEQTAPLVVAPKDSVRVDTIQSLLPPEVHDAIGAAAQAYDRLQADGRQIAFFTDPHTGKITIQLRDLQGRVLRRIAPSEALDAAGGATIE
jgi:hypothetical protein